MELLRELPADHAHAALRRQIRTIMAEPNTAQVDDALEAWRGLIRHFRVIDWSNVGVRPPHCYLDCVESSLETEPEPDDEQEAEQQPVTKQATLV